VVGDVDRLQQVLWNLLSNAIKFTPASGQIEVRLESLPGQAQIQVINTGEGISADLLPYIFDRFRQGDSSPSKPKTGLGLGLAIVWYLVELHGGTVQAESPGEGQGTTLTVRLPLRDRSQELARSSELEPTPLEATPEDFGDPVPSLSGLRILVVDDEVDICELFEFVLNSYGAEVLTVTSARQALFALNANPNQYDALICDIGMPEEDGYWLIQQVRRLEAGGQIPAAALTAYASSAEIQLALEAGFQIHVAKPVDPLQLVSLVVDLVRR
jgi:two-component system, chemotaxis family, CheB/CheR fusion protein